MGALALRVTQVRVGRLSARKAARLTMWRLTPLLLLELLLLGVVGGVLGGVGGRVVLLLLGVLGILLLVLLIGVGGRRATRGILGVLIGHCSGPSAADPDLSPLAWICRRKQDERTFWMLHGSLQVLAKQAS